MTEATFDLHAIHGELGAAAAAMQSFAEGPARKAADDVAIAFERSGERIARALGRAAAGGEVSFRRLAQTVLEEFARVALDKLLPAGRLPFFGARAAGGAVNTGGAYLVGERGPEMFVPRQGGALHAGAGGAVAIHFHLGAGADATNISRHQGQIAAAVARAVAYGRRNL